MSIRVLLLESINDNLSRTRAEKLIQQSILEGVIIDHCYAINPTKEDVEEDAAFRGLGVAELSYWLSQGSPLEYEELSKTLRYKIQDFGPDIILLHTGIVFATHPNMFLAVLSEIKEMYPNTRVGFEGRAYNRHLDGLRLFDRDEMTKMVEEMVFGVMYV